MLQSTVHHIMVRKVLAVASMLRTTGSQQDVHRSCHMRTAVQSWQALFSCLGALKGSTQRVAVPAPRCSQVTHRLSSLAWSGQLPPPATATCSEPKQAAMGTPRCVGCIRQGPSTKLMR